MKKRRDLSPQEKEIIKTRRIQKVLRNLLSYTLYAAVIAVIGYGIIELWTTRIQKIAPATYNISGIALPSFSSVNETAEYILNDGKVDIDGNPNKLIYEYKPTETPFDDINRYTDILQEKFGAKLLENSSNGYNAKLEIPVETNNSKINVSIDFDGTSYIVTLKEHIIKEEKPISTEYVPLISKEEAFDLLMTLTRKETGFTANIDVYTTNLLPDLIDIDGWKYYVFEVIADYSPTRQEYRGTFYVSCDDGMILKYNRNTEGTIYLREGIKDKLKEREQGR